MRSRREPLRVGVLLDSFTVPAWVDAALEQLSTAGAQFALVVLVERPRRGDSILRPRRAASPPALYDLYTRVDRRLFRRSGDAFDPVDARSRFTCDTLEIRAEDLGSPENLARIEEHRLDVLVSFLAGDPGSEVARSARYGLWSFPVNDEDGLRFFRSLAGGEQVTCTELQMQADAEHRRTIFRSFSAGDSISLHRMRNDVLWKASSFVARRLRDLPPRSSRRASASSLMSATRPTCRWPASSWASAGA